MLLTIEAALRVHFVEGGEVWYQERVPTVELAYEAHQVSMLPDSDPTSGGTLLTVQETNHQYVKWVLTSTDPVIFRSRTRPLFYRRPLDHGRR